MSSVRRTVLVVLVLLAALVVGAVLVDRYLRDRAEDEVANRIEGAFGTASPPDVRIGGFPFLTQVLAGEIGRADVRAPGVVVDGIRLDDVDVSARGVVLGSPATAEDLDLTARITDATLAGLLADRVPDPTVVTTPDGVEIATEVLGVRLEVTAVPTAAVGGLVVEITAARLGGAEIDPGVVARLLPEEALTIDVPLPAGLEVVAVEPEDGGLGVVAAGQDVALG